LSQGEIAALSGTEKTKISAYENGHEGIGKDVMARLCNALKVRPFDFYFEATVPAIADPEEKQQISLFREARALGVAEDLARYGSYRVGEAKRERVAGGKESPDDRIKRKLAALKPLEPGRDRRTGRERRTPKKSSA
jgi:transcriptional regulator with XRE-family HTH domain